MVLYHAAQIFNLYILLFKQIAHSINSRQFIFVYFYIEYALNAAEGKSLLEKEYMDIDNKMTKLSTKFDYLFSIKMGNNPTPLHDICLQNIAIETKKSHLPFMYFCFIFSVGCLSHSMSFASNVSKEFAVFLDDPSNIL